MKIMRKGHKEDIVYFGDEVEAALLEYIEHRTEIFKPIDEDADALFISSKNRRISVRAVELLVKKYAMLTTTVKHITPHKLRSTCATTTYKHTGDIYLTASVLGHKNIQNTRRYAAVADSERKTTATKLDNIFG